MDAKLEAMGGRLRSVVEDQGIIARCELLHRVYEAVREADLDESERDELTITVGKSPAPGIFASILSGEPIFPDFPKIDSFILIRNRIFHFVHTKRPSKDEFHRAYARFQSMAGELQDLIVVNLADLATDFMRGAGYRVTSPLTAAPDPDCGSVVSFADESGQEVEVHIFSRIGSFSLEDFLAKAGQGVKGGHTEDQGAEGRHVVLVPHEERLDPFVDFFREKGEAAEEAGLQIWVANMEDGSIDPFIGYTRDMMIYNRFKNPRLSEMVRSTWGRSR